MPQKANQKALVQLIKQISGQANVLTIPRIYITLTGDIKSALVLSQAVYWSDRSNLENGWFYKTYAEWEAETGITKRQMGRILRDLAPFITTRVFKRDVAPVVHYLVDIQAVTDAVTMLCSGLSPNVPIDSDETSQSIVTECNDRSLPNVTIDSDQMSLSSIRHRLPTETTTETTSSSYPPPQINSEEEEVHQFHILDQRLVDELIELGIYPEHLVDVDQSGWDAAQIRAQVARCREQGREPANLLLYRARKAQKIQTRVIGYAHYSPPQQTDAEPDQDPGQEIDQAIQDAWSNAAMALFGGLPQAERYNWIDSIRPTLLFEDCLYLSAHQYAWNVYIQPNYNALLEHLGDLGVSDLAVDTEANVD